MRFYIGVDCGLVKEVDLILGKEGRKPSRVVKNDIYAHNQAKKQAEEAEGEQEPEIEQIKIRDIGTISKAAAVQKLCWCSTNFSASAEVGQKLAWVARAQGVIDLIDVRSEHVLYTYTSSESKDKDSRWIGLYSTSSELYACENGGTIHRLQFDPSKGYEPTEVVHREFYSTPKQVEVFVANPQQPTIVATGGKELELSLWDLNTLFLNPQEFPKPLFAAKNVPNDKLDLKVPVWVMAAQFLTPTIKNSHRVAIATRFGQVRVYESSAKRRPVIDHQVFSTPILSLEASADEKQVVLSNNVGDLQVLDLEKGTILGKYKGITGSVKELLILNHAQGKDIVRQPPLLVSVAMDRFLRVHHFQVSSRALIRRVYLKQRPTSILVDESSLVREITPAKRAREEHEDIWKQMDTVPLSKRPNEKE